MKPIKHVLFPFDFSRQGYQGIPFVHAMAAKWDARVSVLSIVPPVWNTPAADVPAVVDEEGAAKESDLRSRMERAFANELRGIRVSLATAPGDPALKVVEFAHKNDADLIMMPTHGFGIFRSMLIGSVTAKVLHDAHCPVWTATHAEEQRTPAEPRSILCAVDGDQKTVDLMGAAAEFAKTLGASLRLLHVVHPISDWLAIPSERELQEQVRAEARAKMEDFRASARVDAPLTVAVGKITDTVAEEARKGGAHLIVVGRGTAQSALGRLRTHVYPIVQQSPCPVLSI